METPNKIAEKQLEKNTVTANPSESILFKAIVDNIVQKQMEERAKNVAKGFEALDSFQKALLKIRPDIVTYNVDGSVNSALYSKEVYNKKNKLEEKITKLTNVIDKVFSDPTGYNEYLNQLDKLIKEPD
jgi:hypothetical protein